MNTIDKYISSNGFTDVNQMIHYVDNHMMSRANEMKTLYGYYIGDTDIKKRVLGNTNKVNNKLASDFFGQIIDDKVGYYGSNIKTTMDVAGIPKEKYDKNMDFITKWERVNNVEDLDADTVKLSSICGYSARLLYNGKNGARVRNVPRPWEVTLIRDDDSNDPILGFWFYDKVTHVGNVEKKIRIVELYDEEFITTYEKSNAIWTFIERQPHLFNGVPLILIDNNSERMGDYEKAVDLINAYDKALSDVSSEMEQLRLAYAILSGGTLDDDVIEQMKQTGVLAIDEKATFSFTTKTLDSDSIRLLLDEIRKNIFAFCKSIDFAQVTTGDIRVLGWQTKLLPLENKCKIAERKMLTGLRYQYSLLCDYWKVHSYTDIDVDALDWKFTRNIPKDVAGETDTLAKLSTILDMRTALEQVSFISDPDEVLDRIALAAGKDVPAKASSNTPDIGSTVVTPENKSGTILDN